MKNTLLSTCEESSLLGDTIVFGKYKNKEIEWIVLDEREDGSQLLLSKYILFKKRYHNKSLEVTWETCALRKWLNTDFVKKAFTSSEQSKIQTTHVVNKGNEMYGTEGGKDTEDKVFLLSIEEVNQYLNSDEIRIARNLDNNQIDWYWLRSPGLYADTAAYVFLDWDTGEVNVEGYEVHPVHHGVRPAIWVNLESSINNI